MAGGLSDGLQRAAEVLYCCYINIYYWGSIKFEVLECYSKDTILYVVMSYYILKPLNFSPWIYKIIKNL